MQKKTKATSVPKPEAIQVAEASLDEMARRGYAQSIDHEATWEPASGGAVAVEVATGEVGRWL